jgi:LemA protein
MLPLILLALLVAAAILAAGAYNGLVRLTNEVRNGWSQIDVQLRRRHDLIPNLVETVRGYASHERETLEKVTAARARAVAAGDPAERSLAESGLSAALGRLLGIVEQYPDLEADQNFLALQEELTATENRIGFARQFYNDSVMRYNTRVATFPVNLVAALFGFSEEAFFEVSEPGAREAPEVRFSQSA